MLNRLFITFSTVPRTMIKGIPTLLSTIKNMDCRLLDLSETVLIETLLFGNCSVDDHTNTATEYILSTKRFGESLFQFQ